MQAGSAKPQMRESSRQAGVSAGECRRLCKRDDRLLAMRSNRPGSGASDSGVSAPKPPPSQAKLHSLPDGITIVAPSCGSPHVNVWMCARWWRGLARPAPLSETRLLKLSRALNKPRNRSRRTSSRRQWLHCRHIQTSGFPAGPFSTVSKIPPHQPQISRSVNVNY